MIKFIIALFVLYAVIAKVGTYFGSLDCVDLPDGEMMCSDYGIVSYSDQDCLLINNVTNNYLVFCPK